MSLSAERRARRRALKLALKGLAQLRRHVTPEANAQRLYGLTGPEHMQAARLYTDLTEAITLFESDLKALEAVK